LTQRALSNQHHHHNKSTPVETLFPPKSAAIVTKRMADNLQSRVFSVINQNENLSRPLFHKGKYGNPWDTWGGMPGLKKILKWQLGGSRPKMLSTQELNEQLPVIETNWEAINNPPADQLQVTWIGHSTFLVQIDGLNFLTDPVWSDRCSPVQFAGPKRFRHVPFEIKQLPKIDFVVVSHNHYDHLDHYAVTTLQHHQKDHPPVWIVPSGLGKWFKDNLGHKVEVVELNWWDCVPLSDKIEVTATPAQHWSKRGPTDYFYTLWGSYVIHNKTTGKKIFFAGDTGYCSAFKEIGNKFGSIDLGLIPIGAYEPRDIMKNQHVDPEEAVLIHKDINSKQSIGMHWGTFVLTDEKLMDPERTLEEILAREKMDQSEFTTLTHGETRKLVNKNAEINNQNVNNTNQQ